MVNLFMYPETKYGKHAGHTATYVDFQALPLGAKQPEGRLRIEKAQAQKLRMLDIRQLIQDDIANAKDPKAVSVQKKQECLHCIDAYIGDGARLDCLKVLSTGWLDGFEKFMTSAPISKKGSKPLSPATAKFRKKTLISYCREAIKQYGCPNLRISNDGEAAGDKEIDRLKEQPRKNDLEHLLSSFYNKMERCKAGGQAEDALNELKAQTRSLGYAVLSVILCGVGYEGLAKILSENIDGVTVRLPHLDVELTLPEHIFSILQWLQSSNETVTEAKVSNEALRIVSASFLAFKEGFKEPFTQWLEIALGQVRNPINHTEARKIIDHLYTQDDDTEITVLVQKAFDRVVGDLRNFSYSWYCIKSAPSKEDITENKTDGQTDREELSDGSRLLKQIEKDASVHPIDSFTPSLRTVKERNGKKEIRKDRFLDTLLFVKVNQLQIEAINRYLLSIRGGFIYGILGVDGMKYSRIKEEEVDILRDFFSDINQRKIKSETIDNPKDLQGRKAQVLTGLYEGYDGTIVKAILDKDRKICRLIVQLQGASTTVTYTVDPEYIELGE